MRTVLRVPSHELAVEVVQWLARYGIQAVDTLYADIIGIRVHIDDYHAARLALAELQLKWDRENSDAFAGA